MKTIENKVTSLPKDKDTMANYADLFIAILNRPLQKTTTLKEMRRDLKLIDKLEESGEVIEVTDDDFEYLHELAENSEWAIRHVDILEWADYIDSLA